MSINKSFFSFNNGNYAETMLAYYLYGYPTPPTKDKLANDMYIRESKEIWINISSVDYMEHVGSGFPIAQQNIFQKFFNSNLDKNHFIGDVKNGKIYVSHVNFIKFAFGASVQVSDKEYQNLLYSNNLVVSQYSLDPEKSDYWKRALVFGSTSFALDTESIRYVFDQNTGKPLYLDNIRLKPNEDNYDLESSDGLAAMVNPILKSITDPSGIGRKVNIKYEGDFVTLNSGRYTREEYLEYVEKHPNKEDPNIPKRLSPYNYEVFNRNRRR